MLGSQCAGGSRNPSFAFSAVGVGSRSSISGVDSTAVAGPVDIDAMMGDDDEDAAAAGAAAPAAVRAAEAKADQVKCCGACGRLIGLKILTQRFSLDV